VASRHAEGQEAAYDPRVGAKSLMSQADRAVQVPSRSRLGCPFELLDGSPCGHLLTLHERRARTSM